SPGEDDTFHTALPCFCDCWPPPWPSPQEQGKGQGGGLEPAIPLPVPGGRDDLFQILEFGFPAQFRLRFGGAGDQARRIARAARAFDRLDGVARNALARRDDLAHRVALLAAQVVEVAR